VKLKLFILIALFLVAGFAFAQSVERAAPFMLLQATGNTTEKKPDQPESYDINYVYDPGGRRDPFINLLTGIKQKELNLPKGALTVTDAKVVGITRNKDGFVAIITGTDGKARFMKVGDKLYDGEIIGIDADQVRFRQDLTEDNAAAPGLKSKEVVKRLNPVQEGT
jgi:hypothetical protein